MTRNSWLNKWIEMVCCFEFQHKQNQTSIVLCLDSFEVRFEGNFLHYENLIPMLIFFYPNLEPVR